MGSGFSLSTYALTISYTLIFIFISALNRYTSENLEKIVKLYIKIAQTIKTFAYAS